MEELKILGVCAGNGVILHPFLRGPFTILGNVEPRPLFYSPGNNQWKANFGDIGMWRLLPLTLKGVDVIVGHPDCGDSSILRYSRAKKLGTPTKNHSQLMFFDAITFYKPKFFQFENLPGLLKVISKARFKEIWSDYKLVFHVGSVTAFGNSQKDRKRLVIVGVRRDLGKGYVKYFQNKYVPFKIKTTGELLWGLPKGYDEDVSMGHAREPLNSPITLYAGQKYTAMEIHTLWLSRDRVNDKRWKTPHKKFKTAPGVYRNLTDSIPATVRKGNREFNPQGLMMTPRERARIQGIPDYFKIHIDPNNTQYWINKGRTSVTKCPPYEISQWFYKCLKKIINDKTSF